jgi:hypothetical protein
MRGNAKTRLRGTMGIPPGTSVGDGLLARALTDVTTGLPSVLYFRLIRDWEERRAKRRGYRVRVLRVTATGGDDRIRKSLSWRICREFRSSDLIASDGPSHFRLLLTSPDAENLEIMRDRLEQLALSLNEKVAKDTPVALVVEADEERAAPRSDPCEPCDVDVLRDSGEGRRFDEPRPPGREPAADTDRAAARAPTDDTQRDVPRGMARDVAPGAAEEGQGGAERGETGDIRRTDDRDRSRP